MKQHIVQTFRQQRSCGRSRQSAHEKIVGGFAFFQAISLSLSASLRSADKARYPMYVSVVVNILNIFGNYTLIFGKLGMPAL